MGFYGVFFYSIHFYYLFSVIYKKGEGEFRLIIPLFVVFYFSIYSALWFFLSSRILWILKNKIISFYLVTVLHIWFIYNHVFWIFQKKCGYVFSLPLLPLLSESGYFRYLKSLVYGFVFYI